MNRAEGRAAIIEAVRSGRRFLVTSHVNPDGDAVGAVLAVLHLLRSLGKDARAALHDPVPQTFAFLPGACEITGPEGVSPPYDLTILVDCGQADRAGTVVTPGAPGFGRSVNLDHHATAVPWADVNWIDPHASSTCELVHALILDLVGKPDLDMAVCVYTGILTDTGSFRYSNTTARVLELAASLVERGVDPAQVATLVYDTVPYPTLRLLGLTLSTMRTTPDGLIAWITVPREHLTLTGTAWDATEEFVNYPRSIPSAHVAVCFKEVAEDRVKVSLRSRGRVDVSRIAVRHGGGGHRNAAGCFLPGPLDAAVAAMTGEIHRELLGAAGGDGRGEPPAACRQT